MTGIEGKSFQSEVIQIPGTRYVALARDDAVTPGCLACGDIIHDRSLSSVPEVKAACQGKVAWDIGAFIGDSTSLLLELGAWVVAIEPQPDAFECLVHNCPEADCRNLAVGNGSRLRLQSLGEGNLGARGVFNDPAGEQIAHRLDDLELPLPGFVKIDVEGYEPYVLQGMRATLQTARPLLVIEINPVRLAGHGFTQSDVAISLPGYRMRPVTHLDRVGSTEPWDVLCVPEESEMDSPADEGDGPRIGQRPVSREELHWLMANTPNPRHLWEEDAAFNAIYVRVHTYSLVDKTRCYNIFQCARHVSALSGEAAELGVYRGGTARLIAETMMAYGKSVHLFDTFCGLPAPRKDIDAHNQGDFSDTSLEAVQGYLADVNNVSFHAGLFPESAQDLDHDSFCLVHLDCDLHESVAAGLEFFYPRLVAGGIMVIDDYGTWSCHGCTVAVDDFLSDKPEKPIYIALGQAMIVKQCS